MLGGISYSPRSMAGKNPILTTAALKHTPLVASWCPNSAHVPLFWKAIQTFIENKGWESINLGWDNVVSGPRIPAFYSAACSATSCLPAPQVPLCRGWIGVVCPAPLCLASCLHRGSWYLASLFNQNGKQHLMSNETKRHSQVARWGCWLAVAAGSCSGWHQQRGWFLLLLGLIPLLGAVYSRAGLPLSQLFSLRPHSSKTFFSS